MLLEKNVLRRKQIHVLLLNNPIINYSLANNINNNIIYNYYFIHYLLK